MFDLTRMEEAETALRALAGGKWQPGSPAPQPRRQTQPPAQCPFHQRAREEAAA